MSTFIKCISLAALVAALAATSPAQLNRATLTGLVTDPSGAAVVNAKITAVARETNMTFATSTTDTGNYTLPALDIGTYRISAEAPGFKRAVRDSVQVTSGATVRLDLTMELGQVSESIEVSAQASALETETTRVATNLTTKLVEDLPLVVAGQIRNVFNLAIIAPEAKTGKQLPHRRRPGFGVGDDHGRHVGDQRLGAVSVRARAHQFGPRRRHR
jgi:hypothetical protein